MIRRAAEFLSGEAKVGTDGMWMGQDLANEAAAKFYERVGFKRIEGAWEGAKGIKLESALKL